MNQLSKTILENHQKRKTKKQKNEFIALLREHFPEMQEEVGGSMKSRNLLFGELENAKVVLTAHIMTPARCLCCPTSSCPIEKC